MYFTFLSHLFPLQCGAGSTVPRERVRLKCYYALFLVCCGCDTSYIVSVHIQFQASLYTLSSCRGHSWRVWLAKHWKLQQLMFDKAAFQQIVLGQISLNLIMHLFYINWTTYLSTLYICLCIWLGGIYASQLSNFLKKLSWNTYTICLHLIFIKDKTLEKLKQCLLLWNVEILSQIQMKIYISFRRKLYCGVINVIWRYVDVITNTYGMLLYILNTVKMLSMKSYILK